MTKRSRPYEAVYNALISRAKRIRKFTATLTYEEFLEIVALGKCFYCGEELYWPMFNKDGSRINVGQIDRVDNTKGYISGNCVPCCKTCNRAKLTQTEQEFFNWISRVYSHLQKKGLLPANQ